MVYTLYHLHEFKNAAMVPTHLWSEALDIFMRAIPEDLKPYSKLLSASSEMLERSTRVFSKPEFGLATCERDGETLQVEESDLMSKPFCDLKYFQRIYKGKKEGFSDPKVLIVAPLSGHFATLLRDTVRAMLPMHNVYITDWKDSKHVSLKEGNFTIESYIDYLLDFIRFLGKNVHIIAVCQPSVPVMCAVSLLAEYNEPCQPRTMTLMGGPIDTRINPGKVNSFSTEHSMDWFRKNLITTVPAGYAGSGRRVCPGFLMLTGFMSLNIQRHREASLNLFEHLIRGDEESAESHRRFYDEYRSVLDMPGDYFLDSIRIAFKEHSLPKGLLSWRGYPIRPEKIKRTALMTVEGELDDISCVGQTYAAHELCKKLDPSMKYSHVQPGVGHYGIFNGRRWRDEIQPLIAEFIRNFDKMN